jgi:ATP-dependent Clp protease ATP-binding subunit ClpA
MPAQSSEPVLTDRATRALEHAREVQRELGHPALAAEHILLGVLRDRRGMSAFVLRELDVKEPELADRVRSELERAAPAAGDEAAVLEAARRWARELNQVSVGTEHLLLALIGGDSRAARWLADAGAGTAAARATTERLFTTVRRRSGAVEPPVAGGTAE